MILSDNQRENLAAVQATIASRRQPGQRGGRVPKQLRQAVLALIESGLDVEVVSRQSGIGVKAIAGWLTSEHKPALVREPLPRVFAVEPVVAPDAEVGSPVRLLVGGLEISIAAAERL